MTQRRMRISTTIKPAILKPTNIDNTPRIENMIEHKIANSLEKNSSINSIIMITVIGIDADP